MPRATYRFFDAAFAVESDSQAFLDRFDASYAPFRVDETVESPVHRVQLGAAPYTVTVGDTSVQSGDAEALTLYAYNAVLNEVTSRVESSFLVHAAALRTPSGDGAVLAGEAGFGKTTLTMKLCERGFGFLSDELAALGREDGQLHPFPRRLGLRPANGRPGLKTTVEMAAVAQACPARYLFVLADGKECTAPDPAWYMVIDRIDDRLVEALKAIPAIESADVVRREPHAVVRVHMQPGALLDVEDAAVVICREHGALLFEIARGREEPPRFERAPQLERIGAAEAGRELLRHLKGSGRSSLVQNVYGGAVGRVLLALTEMAKGMECYRLQVGELGSMVEVIEKAVGSA
jgi:hypothetical protein